MSIFGVPAVVVGRDLNALGVVRSLGAAGVPVIVLGSRLDGPAMESRYVARRVRAPQDGPGLLDALVGIARESRVRPVLFLTEERTVCTVSDHRDGILEHFRIRLPAQETLSALMHKQGFQEIAERHAALVPRLVHLRSRTDLPALGALRFPCVFKPGHKDYNYGARFKKAYVVECIDEIERLYAEIEPVCPDMVAQEWIDGSDSDIYFCLQYRGSNGQSIASFVGRKIRSWPPRTGGTASCTAAWDDAEELTQLTQEFFSRAGFTGMGAMEYKRDRRDGRFYMVEPTVARTDFQEEVATIHGVNIPLAAYCHELDLDPAPALHPIAPKRIVWRESVTDRRSIALQGEEQAFSVLPVRGAHWRLIDPGPGIGWLRRWVRDRVRGLQRRLLRAA